MLTPPVQPLFLTLAGIVNQEMSCRVFQTFASAIRDGYVDVHLLIQSTGGFIGDGIAIVNYLSGLPISLTTYNVGHVASVAVPVFLSGYHRVAADTATFMIHRPHNTSVGGPANAVTAAAHSLRIDEDRCEQLLRSKMILPDDQWAIYAQNDLTFSAKEAIEYGAVHKIGSFCPSRGAPLFNI